MLQFRDHKRQGEPNNETYKNKRAEKWVRAQRNLRHSQFGLIGLNAGHIRAHAKNWHTRIIHLKPIFSLIRALLHGIND